jgi:hypothetical protein
LAAYAAIKKAGEGNRTGLSKAHDALSQEDDHFPATGVRFNPENIKNL